SNNAYRLGFITPDIECNVPERDCDAATPKTQPFCCDSIVPLDYRCPEEDLDGDGRIDRSLCDGGRLRSHNGIDRIFERPPENEIDPFLEDVEATIEGLGCTGSGYEGGLEAIR